MNQKENACILARVVKNVDPDSNEWVVKVYGQLENTVPHFGELLPEMRDLLSDVIPHCQGSCKDIVKYAAVDTLVELSSLLQANLNVVITPPPADREDEGEPPISPQDVTLVSVGFNWQQIGDMISEIEIGCLMLDNDRLVSDSIGAEKPSSSCGSVSQGVVDDDEGVDITSIDTKLIQINLLLIPDNVQLLAFYLINGRTGETLQCIESVSAHVFETDSKREVILMDCPLDAPYTMQPTLLLCLLIRKEGKWSFINASKPSPVSDLLENGVQLEEYLLSNSMLIEMLPMPAPTDPEAQNDEG